MGNFTQSAPLFVQKPRRPAVLAHAIRHFSQRRSRSWKGSAQINTYLRNMESFLVLVQEVAAQLAPIMHAISVVLPINLSKIFAAPLHLSMASAVPEPITFAVVAHILVLKNIMVSARRMRFLAVSPQLNMWKEQLLTGLFQLATQERFVAGAQVRKLPTVRLFLRWRIVQLNTLRLSNSKLIPAVSAVCGLHLPRTPPQALILRVGFHPSKII